MSIVSLLSSRLRRLPFARFAVLALAPLTLLAQGNFPSAADGFDPNVNGIVYALAVQADGKILVAGNFTTLQPNGAGTPVSRNNLARVNPDGTLDPSFNPNVNSQVNAIAVQPDGRIVIGGVFTTVGGVPRNCLARLNADGSLDSSINFTFANSPPPSVNALVVQADGKIVVGGAFTAVLPAGASAAIGRNRAARFNADGSLDAGFNPNADGTVYSLALQTDGRVLIGGLFTTLQPTGSAAVTRNHIARLNSDGSVDAAFDPNANASVMVMAIQSDGGILIGGFFTSLTPNGTDVAIVRSRLARLIPDGSLDMNFDPNAGSNITALAVQPDGGILVGGLFNTIGGGSRSYCARLGPTGLLDNFFDAGANQVINAFAVQADGKIVIGGNFIQLRPSGAIASNRNHLARLNTDGSPDANFDPSLGGRVGAMATQPDGKVILGGVFSSIGGVARNNLARINANGSLDGAFDPNVNGTVSVVAVQADGKIVVGGTFTSVSGTTRNNIARLNADGSLDTGFDPNASAAVTAIAFQPDNKILIGGFFGAVQPNGAATTTLASHLARLNADGTLDTTFAPVFNGEVLTIKLLPDGKIVAGGNFIALASADGTGFPTAQNYIVKMSAAGVVDTTFSPNPNNRVDSLVIQADGKIVIGGFFSLVAPNGTFTPIARNRIARLNADGSLDDSFDPNAGNEVRTVALQADGKILLGGTFPTLKPNGSSDLIGRNFVARLNADGTVDTGFDAKASGAINTVVVQADGKILLGGAFTSLQPTGSTSVVSRNHVARLNADGSIDAAYDPSFSNVPGTLVTALAVQGDGKILLGGAFANIGGANGSNLVRFKPDGTLDSTFNPIVNGSVNAIGVQTNTGATATQGNAFAWLNSNGLPLAGFSPTGDAEVVGQVNVVFRQPDGGVLLGGSFTNLSGATNGNLIRLKTDGTLDASFSPNPNGRVSAILRQSDGKLIIGGSFTTIGATTRNHLARLNADGSLDTAYDPNLTDQVNVLLMQPDGKLLVGGAFVAAQPNGSATAVARDRIARFNADGTLDTGFDPDANDQVSAIALQADGKILIGGLFGGIKTTARNHIARLNADGSLDLGFDPNANNSVLSIVVQPDGNILLGGTFTTVGGWVRNFLARVFPDGGNDPGFDPNLNGPVTSLVLQPDSQILVGGAFSSIAGTTRNNVARITGAGAIDPNFDPNANDQLNALALQPDGSLLIGGLFTQLRPFGVILVGGAFSNISGAAVTNLALLNEDGNPNAAFRPNPNAPVNAFALQPDGRILVGGAFTSIAGVARNRLVRFNADGSLDAGFNPDVNDQVNAMALQPDGRIVIGGAFTSVGGTARSRLARLNADGSLDGGFNPGANDSVTTLVVQANGSVVIGGAFTSVSGAGRNGLARVSATGALDGAFNPSANAAVNTLALQADGGILVGGAFTTLGGVARSHLARLAADGSLDALFDPAADDVVYAMVVQADGKPLVGGAFARVGGQVRYRFARLAATTVAAQRLTLGTDLTTLTWNRGGSAPELAWVTFEQSTDATTWTSLGPATRVDSTSNWRLTSSAIPTTVGYYVRARGAVPSAQYSSAGLIEMVQKFVPQLVGSTPGDNNNTVGSVFFDANTSSYEIGRFSASGLPAGLTIDPITGIISGVTTQTGTVVAMRTATSGTNVSTSPLTLVLGADAAAITHPVNASIRAYVSSGHPIFEGFVVTGNEPKTILVRGVGPGLTALGVPGALAVPHLLLFDASGRLLAENDGWANDGNLAAAFATVGTFPFAANSADAAVVATLPPGAYTMEVVDGSGTGGIALAEVYDAASTQSTETARFGNMSARGPSAGNGNPLIAGFVITGTAPKRLLVRGIGPGLTGYGVTDALSNPLLGVYDQQGHLIAQNDDWTTPLTVDPSQPAVDAATISALSSSVGAFALGSGGKDAVVIVTLAPGLYTVQVSGVNNVTGSALAELYELP